jgi:hypothetical protein
MESSSTASASSIAPSLTSRGRDGSKDQPAPNLGHGSPGRTASNVAGGRRYHSRIDTSLSRTYRREAVAEQNVIGAARQNIFYPQY